SRRRPRWPAWRQPRYRAAWERTPPRPAVGTRAAEFRARHAESGDVRRRPAAAWHVGSFLSSGRPNQHRGGETVEQLMIGVGDLGPDADLLGDRLDAHVDERHVPLEAPRHGARRRTRQIDLHLDLVPLLDARRQFQGEISLDGNARWVRDLQNGLALANDLACL